MLQGSVSSVHRQTVRVWVLLNAVQLHFMRLWNGAVRKIKASSLCAKFEMTRITKKCGMNPVRVSEPLENIS